MKNLTPWLILIAVVAIGIWKWPKPSPETPDKLRALNEARDSIQKLYWSTYDSLILARGEKIILEDRMNMQFKDLEILKKKYENLLHHSYSLDAHGSLVFLHSWTSSGDSIPFKQK